MAKKIITEIMYMMPMRLWSSVVNQDHSPLFSFR